MPDPSQGAYTEYGFTFKALENKVVRAVGVYDVGSDGLEADVSLKIEGINSSENNKTYLFDKDESLPLVKGYRYKTVTPFTLPAGDYRVLAQDTTVIGVGSTSGPLFKFSPSDPASNYELPGETFSTTVGFEFSLSKPKVATALGIYYPTGGLENVNKISLWAVSNPSNPLASVEVNSGTYTAVNNFVWISISPLILNGIPGGISYRVGVYYTSVDGNPADTFVPEYPSASFSLIEPDTNFVAGYAALGDAYPGLLYTTTPGYSSVFGPNINFEEVDPLQIIKEATTITPLTGIGYSNNIKRNPLTSGITSVTADGSAYFGPMIFVEVNN